MGVVICPDCGGKVSDRLKACPHCGAPIGDVPDTPEPERPEDDDEEKEVEEQRRGCWQGFFIGFFIMLLAGGAAAAYYYFNYMREPQIPVISSTLRDSARSYDVLGEFYDGVAQCRRGSSIFYIDTQGLLVDPPDASAHHVHAPDPVNLVRVERGGRWGMIDRETHDTVIQPIYSTLGNFYDGYALATLKFGDPSMPEYLCIYGYVDRLGGHTFDIKDFNRIDQARKAADRRAYLRSLPKGVTAMALGLPKGTHMAKLNRDSLGSCSLEFDRNGVLIRFASSAPGAAKRNFGVADGFITSVAVERDGMIVRYTFYRERSGDNSETIYVNDPAGRRRVGTVTYNPDDGTVKSYTFDYIPALSKAAITMY